MGGVDQPPGDIEHDRPVLHAHEVAAPPVVLVVVRLDAFDEDQPVRVGGQHGIAGPLGRRGPVGCGIAAPGRRPVRLVVQIGADHGRIAGIVPGQHRPVGDPLLLGVSALVPQPVGVGASPGAGAMVIEDDLQADLAGIGHDLVHDLQAGEAGQIRVLAEVDAVGRAAGVKQLVGEGQTDGVEPQIRHLLHHLLVAARLQAIRRIAV